MKGSQQLLAALQIISLDVLPTFEDDSSVTMKVAQKAPLARRPEPPPAPRVQQRAPRQLRRRGLSCSDDDEATPGDLLAHSPEQCFPSLFSCDAPVGTQILGPEVDEWDDAGAPDGRDAVHLFACCMFR
mmetsp:Transcript_35580/g.70346  ORF Transcript_35580/g.70346 Transcript_35580/m.70346 type:complete len:129 (-) Transcript_35580:63-449(-)